jgi:hypothetical protein
LAWLAAWQPAAEAAAGSNMEGVLGLTTAHGPTGEGVAGMEAIAALRMFIRVAETAAAETIAEETLAAGARVMLPAVVTPVAAAVNSLISDRWTGGLVSSC